MSAEPTKPDGSSQAQGAQETSASDVKRKASKRRRWRPLRWVASLIGLVLTTVVLLLVFVLGTQTGLRTLLAVVEDVAPEMIDVARVEGRVLGRLELDGFALRLPGLEVAIGALVLDWSPGALLTGTLRIGELKARDLVLVSEPSDAEKPASEPFQLPSVTLPIAIDVGQVLIENLRYQQAGADAALVVLARAELSASASGQRVDLTRLTAELVQPDARLRSAGHVQLDGDYPLSLSLDWRFRQPPALELDGRGLVTGDLQRLLVTHHLRGVVEATLQAELREVLTAPSWRGQASLAQVDLPAIAAGAPEVELRAKLDSEGDLQRASLTGTLRGQAAAVEAMGRVAADLDIEWADQVLTINALRLAESGDTSSAETAPTSVADANPAGAAHLDASGWIDTNPSVPEFALDAVWEGLRWPLAGAPLAESPQGDLQVEGALDGYDYRLNAQAFGQQIPETELALAGSGDQQQTEIVELSVKTLGGLLTGKGQVHWAPALDWDLALTAKDVDPGRQWPGLDGRIGLKADTRGDLENGFRYGLKLDAALEAYPPALINLAGTGDAKQTLIEELTIETLGGLVEGAGEAGWSPALVWSFTLDARDIDPGRYQPGLDGRVALTAETSGGLADGYGFRVDGSAELAAYPPTRIELAGQGSAESVELETVAIDVIDGRIDGGATLAWSPALGWDVDLLVKGLDPGQLLADWPGTIGGRIQSAGAAGDDGLVLSASLSDFGGQLRGYPVRVQASLAMQGERIDLETFAVSSGDTRLRASGQADQQLDFRYELRSPSLAALLPDLQGRLDADGRVTGTMAAPRLSLQVDGRDIEMTGQGIERIGVTADIGLAADSPLQLDLSGSNLLAGGQRFDRLTVQGRGSMQAHQLSAALQSDPLTLELAAEGGLGDAGGYRGRLDRLDLTTQDYGNWGLQRPASYSFAGAVVDVGPLCIGNGSSSRGCVAFQQPEAGRFVASLELERLGFDLLDALTPDVVSLSGYLTANARFEGQGALLTGNAELDVPEGAVEVVLPRASETLTFSATRLRVRSDANGLDANFQLPVDNAGRIAAELGLPGFRLSGRATQPLTGRVRIDLDGLDRFAALAPDVSDVQGAIDGDLGLSGSLAEPIVRGKVAARDLALRVPSIGLQVSDLNLTAQSESASLMRISGGADVGGGRFSLDGSVTGIGGAEPSVQIELNGDQLKVADSNEYMAVVSLDLDAGFGPAGGALRGELSVPRAQIMPRALPAGTVQPSPDVVMEEKTEQPPVPFSIDVLAKLGDEVLLEAFGLRGLLRGQLRLSKEPSGPLVGNGELQVVDGTYRVSLPGLGVLTSVGKPLVIEKGIVLFANTPLDNPGIILNAQREGGDITAGVRVLGTLRNPKLAFFSESDPNMTQSEITSYLVTGIPPKRGASADDRSISVGTYIAPKLFMEYDSSLGDKSDSIKMRYDLTESIQVQSETGDAQGVDIFYKFEN